jgi:hypothetical protein
VLDGYTYGFALTERALPFDDGTVAEVAQAMLAQFPVDRFPNLAAMAPVHVMQPGYDYVDEYGWGLDLVLDGLDRLRDGGPDGRVGPRNGPYRGPGRTTKGPDLAVQPLDIRSAHADQPKRPET